ncbi:MAG: signal peptidase II [Rickettsiales bacterium]
MNIFKSKNKIFYIKFITIILVVILLDQISKLYLISELKLHPGYLIKVNEIFDIVYAWNYGISFGIFTEYHQYSNYILLFINSIIVIILLRVFSSIKILSGSLIIGGAIGNLIDRVNHGAVFDFISIHYNDYYFAIFNLADFFVCFGAMLLFFINYKTN